MLMSRINQALDNLDHIYFNPLCFCSSTTCSLSQPDRKEPCGQDRISGFQWKIRM